MDYEPADVVVAEVPLGVDFQGPLAVVYAHPHHPFRPEHNAPLIQAAGGQSLGEPLL